METLERRRKGRARLLRLGGLILAVALLATVNLPAQADLDVNFNKKSVKVSQSKKGKAQVTKRSVTVRKRTSTGTKSRSTSTRSSGSRSTATSSRGTGIPSAFTTKKNPGVAPWCKGIAANTGCIGFVTIAGAPPAANAPAAAAPAPAAGEEEVVVTVTPAQAAQMVVAQLQLPSVTPGIGPSPDRNRWDMAVVGYPLWLWADGDTHVGPVSQTAGGLFVSLDADLTSVSFTMGDGGSVTCDGAGTEWTPAVEPGKASDCGYRYRKPSLPDGDYTVTATSHWTVTWQAGGQTGTIPMDQSGTTTLPVGELQVLNR